MEAIRVSFRKPNDMPQLFCVGSDRADTQPLRTHLLANRAEVDRVYFQLPQEEPYSPVFRRYPIPAIVQSTPGVFMVRQIKAAQLFNERGGITNIDLPERYKVPTYVAHLTGPHGRLHPATLGNFIREMVELAYAPDSVISVFHTSTEVERWEQPKGTLTFQRNRRN